MSWKISTLSEIANDTELLSREAGMSDLKVKFYSTEFRYLLE